MIVFPTGDQGAKERCGNASESLPPMIECSHRKEPVGCHPLGWGVILTRVPAY